MLTPDNKLPRSNWWAYKTYAEMSGKLYDIVRTTNTPLPLADGLAAFDSDTKKTIILLGSYESTKKLEFNVTLFNLDKLSGLVKNNRIFLTTELIPYTSTNTLSSPIQISSGTVAVTNNSLKLSGIDLNPNDAYIIRLQPIVDPPTNLIVTNINGLLKISWTAATNPEVKEYFLYRSTFSGSGYTTVISTGIPKDITAYYDYGLNPNSCYYYVVIARDNINRTSDYSVESWGIPAPEITKVTEDKLAILPNKIDFKQPNSKIVIKYQVKNGSSTGRIKIYTLSGEVVKIFSLTPPITDGTIGWDGKNAQGEKVAAGVYLVQFETNNFKDIKKVVIIK